MIADSPGFYITYSGVKVDPSNLSELRVHLSDIAHHLTNIQRFGGALPFHKRYSVAEHSMIMAEYALVRYTKPVAAMCLLHDASEAYLGDIVSPLKRQLPCYKELENIVSNLIYTKYNINEKHHDIVKKIDQRILLDEVRDLLPSSYELFQSIYPNLEALGVITNLSFSPGIIERKFLNMCEKLGIGD